MPCWIIIFAFMLGSAALGYLLAWFLQPVDDGQGAPKKVPSPEGNKNGTSGKNPAKTEKELNKLKKKYDDLYDSKLDVDTALVAAESTLDGLKLDYERLERDVSGNNNRHTELQTDFDHYKTKKETEIKELRTKTKKATDNYETVKFQLAKSNRINEKLQDSLGQLKDENQNLSTELDEAKEEIEVVNASMSELKADYSEIKNKAVDYNEKLSAWQEKYENLDLQYQSTEDEKTELSEAYENYQVNAGSEIEKLSDHLNSLQTQLEESTTYTNEYAEAYTQSETHRQQLIDELDAQKKEAMEELEEIQGHLKGLEDDYGTIQKREEILDDRFSNLQDKHSDLEDAFKNTVEEKENLEQAYNEYKKSSNEEFVQLQTSAENWVKKLEASDKELAQHKDKADELEENKKNLVRELDKMRQRYEKEMSLSGGEFEALNDTFEGLKGKYFELNKELSSTKLEKERIDFEHSNLQEQVLTELQLIRGENKKLNKSLASLKAEKRLLEFTKEELEERVDELESSGGGAGGHSQAKLIKMINRLQKALEYQKEEMDNFKLEKEAYREKVEILEAQLQNSSNAQTISQLMAEKENKKDDLKKINGIVETIEATLNDFGIYNFEQLANISRDNTDLLSKVIESSPEKINDWVKEAKKMLG